MKTLRHPWLAGLAFCLLSAGAFAPAFARDCQPQLREGWVRLGPAGMPMMAGFGRIENRCKAPVTITGASSPAFGSVELHETRLVDGVNRMRAVPELRIAPDDAAVLKPGGLHLMLMRPHAPLQAGSKVVVQFELAGGGTLLGEFEVRKPNAL
ncbi:copper chaperone PCu(A)C [Luteimonas aquatica]|uniref:copper chaperone PCu(A)C n=1 Tax=Luteimonas aquatica TaxID=450364 RepID=UPI001F59BF00|nr:copper chaperone PCu(A)C [Luteimonas aquatica]